MFRQPIVCRQNPWWSGMVRTAAAEPLGRDHQDFDVKSSTNRKQAIDTDLERQRE